MPLVSMTIRLAFALRSSSKPFFCAGLIALALAPLTLCAQTPSAPPDSARTLLAPPPSVAPQTTTTTNAVTAPSGYVLSANDQVAVEVFGEDDLRTNGRLNAEGNLSLPLLGSVHLAGLSLTQATARVTELYARDYLINPKVNVMLVSYAKRRFTILGQVNRPGSFEMPEGSPTGIDLLEAVAMAGGYTRIAAPERITVRRRGPKGDEILKIDGKRLARGTGGANSSFKVQPGDTITVGESIF
ncbi:MAG: polysaccharide biosynthesis/export protein VpsN [Verrucomicrobiota bacterium]